MTAFQKISLLAGAVAIAALSASLASAQSPDTRITVIGAVNSASHVQPVTDGRDNVVPEMPVVYDNQAQNPPAQAQPTSARADAATQAPARPASAGQTDLSQTVKSQ